MSEPGERAAAGAPLLEVTGVKKSYRIGRRLIEVLAGVSLEVREREFLAVRGASGAGKSTLLHLLGGLDLPDEGEVRFGTTVYSRLSSKALARFRNQVVGYVFQSYHLLPELDALENVCLPARILRTPGRVAQARGMELLNRVGLADRATHRPAELSGGEQQRVAIARALVNGPQMVLADEPTGNLDSRTGGRILDLLCEISRDEGLTLVMATHDMALASRASRLLQLEDGRLAG